MDVPKVKIKGIAYRLPTHGLHGLVCSCHPINRSFPL
jgi:hypothetical protein